jgi:hypothetical protein
MHAPDDAMTYPALTIRQPWAGLIALGRKTIETRTWRLDPRLWRGDDTVALAIHAGQGVARSPAAQDALALIGDHPLLHVAGAVIALGLLERCRAMVPADETAALCGYLPGMWAWCFRPGAVYSLRRPLSVRGGQGIWWIDLGSEIGLGDVVLETEEMQLEV